MTLAAQWKRRLQKEKKTRDEVAEDRANQIIRVIPERLKRRGSDAIGVMELEKGEFTDASFNRPVKLSTLKGAARIVAEYCASQGLYVYIVEEELSDDGFPVEMKVLPKPPAKS